MMNRKPETFEITRTIEIDMAHRVPDHKSKCFNLHGHRYVIDATCEGTLFEAGEQKGMVMDFGFLKTCMITAIHEPFDHGMALYRNDSLLQCFSGGQKGIKLVTVDAVPTAENLARIWFLRTAREISLFFDVNDIPEYDRPKLISLDVWETPNCVARYSPSE